MKFLSYIHHDKPAWGALRDERIVDVSAATDGRAPTLAAALRAFDIDELEALAARHEASVPVSEVRWLPVITDSTKIFCVGLNYEEHRVEAKRDKTANPTVFVRFAASQTGHLQPVVLPIESERLDYEGEIAIIIGRGGRRIPEADAWKHIAGYAPYNDCSVRDWQSHSTQWTAGKNFPSTGAFGPWMTTRSEVADGKELTLITRLNGKEMQRATTAQLIFPIPCLVNYCSTFVDLEPGDVIVTGTPGGVGFKRTPPVFLRAGDTVEVEVSTIGLLRNHVVQEVLEAH
jgi:2-keto-4-pentenoate hydratase/2-oxohepta-3-ene-1,7-dioic acid hydratase in catechol pathway